MGEDIPSRVTRTGVVGIYDLSRIRGIRELEDIMIFLCMEGEEMNDFGLF